MAVKNSTIMEKAWLEGTNDFQQRIPNPSQQGIEATMQALFDPMNNSLYNEFIDTLINRIGMTIVRNKQWKNPLAAFKGGKLNFGSTIQELVPRWIKAHTYQDDVETLLQMNRPSVEACYHSLNRQDKYKITITREELRQAFTEEFGLNSLVSAIMQVPFNSDNYDEYRIMVELIRKYESDFGFYKWHLDQAPTDEESGKTFLKDMRTIVGKLHFPSTLYNALSVQGVPVFADTDDLVLLMTPETKASISVDVLASLFNMEKADLEVRTITIDEFPVANGVALLTTKDWYVCHDKEYTTQSFYNPETLGVNYFLHHWSVNSCSPFVPAILFTTDEGTETQVVRQEITDLELNAERTTVMPDDVVQLFPSLIGTYDGVNGSVQPASSCTYELQYQGDTIINSRTYVDRHGKLHIQKNAVIGDTLLVTAKSTYQNPSGTTPELVASIEIHIGGNQKKKLVLNIENLVLENNYTGTRYNIELEFQQYRDFDNNLKIPVYAAKNDVQIPYNEALQNEFNIFWDYIVPGENDIAYLSDEFINESNTTRVITSGTKISLLQILNDYVFATFDNGESEPIKFGEAVLMNTLDVEPQPESTKGKITDLKISHGDSLTGGVVNINAGGITQNDITELSVIPFYTEYDAAYSQLAITKIIEVTTDVIGAEYQVLYSTDGGSNWTIVTDDTEINFQGMGTSKPNIQVVVRKLTDTEEIALGNYYIYELQYSGLETYKSKIGNVSFYVNGTEPQYQLSGKRISESTAVGVLGEFLLFKSSVSAEDLQNMKLYMNNPPLNSRTYKLYTSNDNVTYTETSLDKIYDLTSTTEMYVIIVELDDTDEVKADYYHPYKLSFADADTDKKTSKAKKKTTKKKTTKKKAKK